MENSTVKDTEKSLTTTQSKPSVDKVSAYEVYLLDKKGTRTRKICGTQRNNQPAGYLCLKAAGDGTQHPGYAQCSYHDRQLTNPNNTSLWLQLNRQAGVPANLLEYLENAEIVQEEHLSSVDDDIKGLYAIMSYVMSRRRDHENPDEGYLTNQDLDLMLKINDKILKAKELRPKLQKEVSLDTATVKTFVDQIFKIILANAAKNVGKRIMQSILDEVIVPLKTQGRIKGGEFDFQPASEEIVAEVIEEDKK